MKWFGCGHKPGGIQGTKQGKLALHCPACPQPSINLPPDWIQNPCVFSELYSWLLLELAFPRATRWLYRLFLAIDANFQLCCLNVSSDQSDPGLNLGYAYFVEETTFRNHIDMFGKVIVKEEKSTCNNHDAVKLANSRGRHGAVATGVGAVVCRQHDMKCPLSVGDLQKGKRYTFDDKFCLMLILLLDISIWITLFYQP